LSCKDDRKKYIGPVDRQDYFYPRVLFFVAGLSFLFLHFPFKSELFYTAFHVSVARSSQFMYIFTGLQTFYIHRIYKKIRLYADRIKLNLILPLSSVSAAMLKTAVLAIFRPFELSTYIQLQIAKTFYICEINFYFILSFNVFLPFCNIFLDIILNYNNNQ
jgi:hypothetical protein